MLELSRDAAVAEEEYVSCAAEKSQYCLICTVASLSLYKLALGAIYLRRVGVVESAFGVALTKV
jgi:hypothetical protein